VTGAEKSAGHLSDDIFFAYDDLADAAYDAVVNRLNDRWIHIFLPFIFRCADNVSDFFGLVDGFR